MYFYHYYIQKGFTPKELFDLDFYERTLMAASLDITLENRDKMAEAKVRPVIIY